MLRYTLQSESDTKLLAEQVAQALMPGQSLGLVGQLGAGKTTFTRFLVAALGVEQAVSSPTFVLEHIYADKNGKELLEHWDLYRLGALPEDLYENSSVIRVVEWADKFPEYMQDLDLVLKFSYNNEDLNDFRQVEIIYGTDSQKIWGHLGRGLRSH